VIELPRCRIGDLPGLVPIASGGDRGEFDVKEKERAVRESRL
jgi:hypothetical protein